MTAAFWPGFRWRVYAHERTKANSRGAHTGKSYDLRSGIVAEAHPSSEIRERLEGVWEFDELVIDDWFHLEQMDDRGWWLGVGNGDDDYWHVNVHIDRDGKASVHVEKQ